MEWNERHRILIKILLKYVLGVNFGSSNGLVSPGNNHLQDLILTKNLSVRILSLTTQI